MWTRFFDMHSGGSQKEDYNIIYIEAPIEEAKIIFYNKFGHNPERVTCTCCGEDYSIWEYEIIEDAMKYDRQDNILIIKKEDIKEEERIGEVPTQGYVWM